MKEQLRLQQTQENLRLLNLAEKIIQNLQNQKMAIVFDNEDELEKLRTDYATLKQQLIHS